MAESRHSLPRLGHRAVIATLLLLAALTVMAVTVPGNWWTPPALLFGGLSLLLALTLAWVYRFLHEQVSTRTHELAHTNAKLTQEIELKDAYTEALQQNDQKLQLAMQVSALAVWDWNIPARTLHINGPKNAFGQRPGGRLIPLRDFVHTDDFPTVRRALFSHVRGQSDQLLVRYRNREEPPRWLEDTGRAVEFDAKQRPCRLLGTRRDITEEVAREQQLTLADSLFRGNREPILVLDRQFRVSAMNPAFADMLHRSIDEWDNRRWSECSHSELTDTVIRSLHEQGHWEGELLEQRANGEAFPLYISFRTVMGNSTVSHYLGFCHDLSTHRASRKALVAGHYDSLTGLPNRAYFHQQLDYYRRMDRLPECQVAVGLLNVDHFRRLNDQFGRTAGDSLLQDIAARLSQYGAPLMTVSRLNGDEFGLLFSHYETPKRLYHLAQQIVADIHRPMLLDQDELLATASLGLIILTQENVHDCMNEATMALHRARRRGGNQVVDLNARAVLPDVSKNTALDALNRLLEQLEHPLRFRPQLYANQHTLAAIRVSSVLDYDALGDVQVEPLYALAQEKHLEERLYTLLLQEACDCLSRCGRETPSRRLLLSFPVNSRMILNERLRALTQAVVRQYDIEPGQLELSFSARVLRHDRTLILAQLNTLQQAGFQIMLEDLEAWPTVLAQLGPLPIHALRVKQPMPVPSVGLPGSDPLHPVVALLAQYCLQFGWALCLSRIDSPAQQEALEGIPDDLLPHSRVEGSALSHSMDPDELLVFLRHQTAMSLPTRRVH